MIRSNSEQKTRDAVQAKSCCVVEKATKNNTIQYSTDDNLWNTRLDHSVQRHVCGGGVKGFRGLPNISATGTQPRSYRWYWEGNRLGLGASGI